jgi:hypothetical protein
LFCTRRSISPPNFPNCRFLLRANTPPRDNGHSLKLQREALSVFKRLLGRCTFFIRAPTPRTPPLDPEAPHMRTPDRSPVSP